LERVREGREERVERGEGREELACGRHINDKLCK